MAGNSVNIGGNQVGLEYLGIGSGYEFKLKAIDDEIGRQKKGANLISLLFIVCVVVLAVVMVMKFLQGDFTQEDLSMSLAMAGAVVCLFIILGKNARNAKKQSYFIKRSEAYIDSLFTKGVMSTDKILAEIPSEYYNFEKGNKEDVFSEDIKALVKNQIFVINSEPSKVVTQNVEANNVDSPKKQVTTGVREYKLSKAVIKKSRTIMVALMIGVPLMVSLVFIPYLFTDEGIAMGPLLVIAAVAFFSIVVFTTSMRMVGTTYFTIYGTTLNYYVKGKLKKQHDLETADIRVLRGKDLIKIEIFEGNNLTGSYSSDTLGLDLYYNLLDGIQSVNPNIH